MEKPEALKPGTAKAGAPTPEPFELFAALVDQLPLESREDLAWVVRTLRGRPEWPRALEHARQQAREIGLALPESGAEAMPAPAAKALGN